MPDPKAHAPKGRIKARESDPMRLPDPLAGMCTAHSKQTGLRCKQHAIPGGNVCRYHGGAAPQVKLAAIERLRALQQPAIDRLSKLIDQDQFPSVAYAASRDVLDRTLGKAPDQLKLTGADDGPIEHVFRWGSPKKGEQ